MCFFCKENKKLQNMATALRFLCVDMIEKAKSGHPGMPLGMADVATVLFSKYIKINPAQPHWFDRDRFVLSAGHGSSLLYSLFYLLGYKDIDLEDLRNFRQLGSKTAGHPEYGHLEGIDITTGPLGQGIASSVGMALAEKKISAHFGKDVCNHYTYVFAGDGCLMEGISEEAVSLAGHWKLNKLIVFWDNNNITIDGTVDSTSSTDQIARFKANGWNTISIDGHDYCAIDKAIRKAQKASRPTLIDCKTKIGFGAPTKSGSSKCHGSPLGENEACSMRQNLHWNYAPFEVPEEILQFWRTAGQRCKQDYYDWEARSKTKGCKFIDYINNQLPQGWDKELQAFKQQAIKDELKVATRKASQLCLERIVSAVPQIIGGSADLAASNLTKVDGMKTISAQDYDGNNIAYGIREHAMGAIINGLSLHGGVIPYGGTFFVFSDYLRPAVRLGALMGIRSIYVLTHDSIGVGEDGPTHQPIEHLASFRAIPNVLMFRPCDAVETAEVWQLAIENENGPGLLALTRQNLPLLRKQSKDNLSARGAYVISDTSKGKSRQATIIASGSEVSLAIKAQEVLRQDGIEVAVVSMPCCELFDHQDESYRQEVLGEAPRIGVEAASGFGWEKYLGCNGKFIGMDSFGASGPADELFKFFNITIDEIVDKVKESI